MSRKVLTNKLKQQIAELVSTGLDIKEACKKLGDVIRPNTVYKEQMKDEKFNDLMDNAYQCHFLAKTALYNERSKMTASEAYPNLDFREGEAALKRECDNLKFNIRDVAAVLSKRWTKVQKIEHTGTVNQGITIVMDDYRLQSIPNVIEHTETPH